MVIKNAPNVLLFIIVIQKRCNNPIESFLDVSLNHLLNVLVIHGTPCVTYQNVQDSLCSWYKVTHLRALCDEIISSKAEHLTSDIFEIFKTLVKTQTYMSCHPFSGVLDLVYQSLRFTKVV